MNTRSPAQPFLDVRRAALYGPPKANVRSTRTFETLYLVGSIRRRTCRPTTSLPRLPAYLSPATQPARSADESDCPAEVTREHPYNNDEYDTDRRVHRFRQRRDRREEHHRQPVRHRPHPRGHQGARRDRHEGRLQRLEARGRLQPCPHPARHPHGPAQHDAGRRQERRRHHHGARGERPAAGAASDIAKALPLVKRALKVLSEREVAPQLGLLKSTLLQLDSTFSEREYGASSFRDFMEKVAKTGAVTLKNAGRSMMVESRDEGPDVEAASPQPEQDSAPPRHAPASRAPARGRDLSPVGKRGATPSSVEAPEPAIDDEDEETMPSSPMTMQDGIRAVQQAFSQASNPPRWPMYV